MAPNPGGKYGLLSRAEFVALMREAHTACKAKVPIVPHTVGKTSPRTRWGRPADQYRACIREYIRAKMMEKARSLGYTVAV